MREKITNLLGGVSGGAGLLGAFSVCHNICLGVIALLGLIGITLIGMPFLGVFTFFEKYSLLFISVGLVSLSLSVFLYISHKKASCQKLDYKFALYAIVFVLLIFGLLNSLFLKAPGVDSFIEHSEENFQTAIQAQVVNDPCAVPPGYSEEDWKEHMSHHPDMYAECL